MRERARRNITRRSPTGPVRRRRNWSLRARPMSCSPNDVGYIARYAQALSAAGRNDEAMAKFDEAMAIEPDHLTVLTRLCEFTRAESASAGGARGRRLAVAAPPGSGSDRDLPSRAQPAATRRCAGAPAPAGALGSPASAAVGRRFHPRRRRPLASASQSPPAASAPRIPASPPMVNPGSDTPPRLSQSRRSPVDIVLLGDSLAHQWPANVWTGRRVFNLGVSGDRTQHVLWRLACFDDGAIDAKAVVLIVGVNNLVCGDDVQSIVEAVGDVIGQARRVAPGAKIAVVVPSAVRSRLPASRRRSPLLNASLASMRGCHRRRRAGAWNAARDRGRLLPARRRPLHPHGIRAPDGGDARALDNI